MPNREKLIELLREMGKKEREQGGVTWYDVADHLIANGVTVQEWISVKDRLPETDEKVLCYKKGEIKIGKYLNAKYTDEIYAFRSLDMTMAFGATHWMPLPHPPKGE